MEVAFLVFWKVVLDMNSIIHPIVDFEVIVLRRELIYMNTFVGWDMYLKH